MRWIMALLLIGISSCVPVEAVQPRLHDIALYNVAETNTLYSYFYGVTSMLSGPDGETLLLTVPEARASDPLAVTGSLDVNGTAYLSQSLEALSQPPFEVSQLQFTSDLKVEARDDLEALVYFDGSMWFTLAKDVNSGFNAEVVPLARFEGLRDLGALSFREADMLEAFLEPLAPVAVGVLTDNPAPRSNVDGLGEYQRTALYIQRDFSLSLSVQPPTDDVFWELIASGNNAAGGEGFYAAIATSPVSFNRLWGNAFANQLSLPAQPQLDYSRESVIAIFMGQRSSGGYGIEVNRVSQEGGELYVDVTLSEPAAGSFTTQAFTHPWLMIRVPEANLRVAWIREAGTTDLVGVARGAF